jgi:hypothetical protein
VVLGVTPFLRQCKQSLGSLAGCILGLDMALAMTDSSSYKHRIEHIAHEWPTEVSPGR